MTFYEKYNKIMLASNNNRVAPFIMEILSNDKNVDSDDVIDFFHYWGDMSDTEGMWIINTAYSFDCPDNSDGEDGVLFDMDTIFGAFKYFCNELHIDYLRNVITEQQTHINDIKAELNNLKCMV